MRSGMLCWFISTQAWRASSERIEGVCANLSVSFSGEYLVSLGSWQSNLIVEKLISQGKVALLDRS